MSHESFILHPRMKMQETTNPPEARQSKVLLRNQRVQDEPGLVHTLFHSGSP